MECIDNRGNESVKTRLLDENENHPGTTADAKVNCAHFVADALIMSTANDKHVRIWDVRTNRILFKQQVLKLRNYFSNCSISDRRRIEQVDEARRGYGRYCTRRGVCVRVYYVFRLVKQRHGHVKPRIHTTNRYRSKETLPSHVNLRK